MSVYAFSVPLDAFSRAGIALYKGARFEFWDILHSSAHVLGEYPHDASVFLELLEGLSTHSELDLPGRRVHDLWVFPALQNANRLGIRIVMAMNCYDARAFQRQLNEHRIDDRELQEICRSYGFDWGSKSAQFVDASRFLYTVVGLASTVTDDQRVLLVSAEN